MTHSSRTWLWLLPLLLLVSWAAAHELGTDYWYDEIRSLAVTGGAHLGPLSPAGIVVRISEGSPEQLVGYPLLLAGWGALVGWSEVAARWLPLLLGLLGLAWTYRLGADLVSRRAGLWAAAMLGSSVYYVYFLHELRAFSLMALATAFSLWVYWRLLHRRASSRWACAGLFLGGLTLAYTHYFAFPVLIGLGGYHLLWARKDRRWWAVTGVLALVALTAALWLPVFQIGYERQLKNEALQSRAMTSPQVLLTIGHYFSHGWPALLLIALLPALVYLRDRSLRYLLWMALVAVAVMLAFNGVSRILEPGRVRYLIVLWPLLAVLVAAGWHHLPRRAGWLALTVWLLVALWAWWGGDFMRDVDGSRQTRDWQTLMQTISDRSQPGDLLIYAAGVEEYKLTPRFSFYTADLPRPAFLSLALFDDNPDNQAWSRSQLAQAERVWLAAQHDAPSGGWEADFDALLTADFVACPDETATDAYTLALYGRSVALCPADEVRLRFGDGITLTGFELLADDTLAMGWAQSGTVPPDTYSLAVHVEDAAGELVAQADTGLPNGDFAPLRLRLDLSALPAGDYALRLIVYNWQTGERLSAYAPDGQPLGDRPQITAFTR